MWIVVEKVVKLLNKFQTIFFNNFFKFYFYHLLPHISQMIPNFCRLLFKNISYNPNTFFFKFYYIYTLLDDGFVKTIPQNHPTNRNIDISTWRNITVNNWDLSYIMIKVTFLSKCAANPTTQLFPYWHWSHLQQLSSAKYQLFIFLPSASNQALVIFCPSIPTQVKQNPIKSFKPPWGCALNLSSKIK